MFSKCFQFRSKVKFTETLNSTLFLSYWIFYVYILLTEIEITDNMIVAVLKYGYVQEVCHIIFHNNTSIFFVIKKKSILSQYQ